MAERVRRYRTELGWSVRRLAEECQTLGAPKLTEASIGNIERGESGGRKRREVTVDEVFVLAYALGAPPLLMMIPLGENEPLEITTTATIHPHLAWQGATKGPLAVTGNVATRLRDTARHSRTIELFERLRATQQAYSDAEVRVRIAQSDGTPELVAKAKDRLADTIPAFAEAVEDILRADLEVPAYTPQTIEALKRSGLVSDPGRVPVYEPATATDGVADGQR